MATQRHRTPSRGRKSGGHNQGFWYYEGRGWYTTENGGRSPLRDESGNHIKDPDAPKELLHHAHALRLLARKQEDSRDCRAEGTDGKPLEEVVLAYLDYCRANGSSSTFERRADFLFDFCYGFPPRFRDKDNGKKPPTPSPNDRIHKGFGRVPVADMIPHHAQEWIDSHENWGEDGGKRFALQALKRALNWAVKMGLITRNPIHGFKVSRGRSRVTNFTPEQEQVLYRFSKKDFALALRVCIRTGARYGSEFAKLTDKHVKETEHGMEWHFPKDETKNKKPRTILVAPEVADIVRQLKKVHGKGHVFRNSRGKPWGGTGLRSAFLRLKKKLAAKHGIDLDADACMYTTRHTFAKRMLSGYWGERVTLLDLADLMGDTRQTVIDHYTKWDDTQKDRLWAGVNAKEKRADS